MFGPILTVLSVRVMESEDALLELLSQAVARKHVVEVRPSTFRCGSTNSEKVTSGDLRSEACMIFRVTQLSNSRYAYSFDAYDPGG